MRTIRFLSGGVAGLLVLAAVVFGAACERPFIEPEAPAFQILEPDPETVLVSPSTRLRLRADSFRDVARVELNGEPLRFQPDGRVWETELQLGLGLNAFLLQAFDTGGTVGTDTLYLVHMPFEFRVGPSLPEPRAGHTATLMANGSLLVVGGVTQPGGPAHAEAYLLPAGGSAFVQLPTELHAARTGHTATLLPDGRVLIVGGSSRDEVTAVSELVETVEVYDPDARRFERVRFGGQPIRRTLHTAALRRFDVLDLYAGRGDIRYEPEPRLGFRRDLRSFILRADSLVALNTLFGAPTIADGIAGHTQTPLIANSPGFPGLYLVAGSFFGTDPPDDLSLRIDFTQPPQILVSETPPMRRARTRHAAVRLQDGFVMLFGGWQDAPTTVLDEAELYVSAAGQYYRLPTSRTPVKRYGHTATKLPTRRILLLGGFNDSGNSLATSEFFDTDFLQ